MDTTKTISTAGGVSGVGIAGVVVFLMQNFVPIADFERLEGELSELRAEVVVGHMIAQTNANIFHVIDQIQDLEGRASLYRVKQEAGLITEGESARWASIRGEMDDKRRELATLRDNITRIRSE